MLSRFCKRWQHGSPPSNIIWTLLRRPITLLTLNQKVGIGGGTIIATGKTSEEVKLPNSANYTGQASKGKLQNKDLKDSAF